MVFWVNMAWWGYTLLWGALLIHCLVKRTFYPILGSGWGTKVFWLVTFVFMNPLTNVNPLLMLLYVIFGVLLGPRTSTPPRTYRAGTICLVLVVAIIGLFELPGSYEPDKVVTLVGEGQTAQGESGFQVQAGVLQANSNLSTTTSSSTSGHAKVRTDSVLIRSRTDHLLIDKICRFMQEKIAELPYVKTVEYRPAGVETTEPLGQTDIVITVEAAEISEGGFGIDRKLTANVSCHVGTEPIEKTYYSHYGNSPPTIQFSMNARLQHTSVFKGFETGRARYKQQSESIAEQFIGAIAKQFDQWIEKHGLLPELPEYMYGQDPQEPPFDFLHDRNATLVCRSGGLLSNCRAIWTYEDDRSNIEAFKEVCDTLRDQGWHGGQHLDRWLEDESERERTIQNFTMTRDHERILVFRTRGQGKFDGIIDGDRESLAKKPPIAVEYLAPFTPEQTRDVLIRFFASDADIEAKLIFENISSDERVEQLLFEAVTSAQVKTLDGYLWTGLYHARKDQMGKAREALMMARVLSRADREHNPAESEFKQLAKKLGDESLAKVEPTAEYYELAGFVDPATLGDPAVFERGVGEPLTLYARPVADPAERDNGIKTVVIRINEVPGQEGQYEVETITKQHGTSGVSKRGLTGRTVIHDSMDGGREFTVGVEVLEGDRFKLTVQKE